MDGDRFDQFTRSLARNVSRRSVVKGLTMLVAGASVAARPLSGSAAKASKGPDPCNVYCAGEPGPRGAQCRQACKDCGGPDSYGFCYDQLNRQYICCPGGLGCFEPFVDEGLHTGICCSAENQVCRSSNEDFYCCPNGETCMGFDLCCPAGTQSTCENACCENDDGCCFSRAAGAYICGGSCFDVCAGEWDCGEAHAEDSSCIATSCYDQCTGEYRCGPPDGQGNCSVETCFDVCQSQTVCGIPNERGNCSYYYTCFDPCSGDSCNYPDGNGYCPGTACYDPALSAFVCGTSCTDFCNGDVRCGTSASNPYGYCDDTICRNTTDGFNCGTPDDDGACIE
jgi:hypothetical protein